MDEVRLTAERIEVRMPALIAMSGWGWAGLSLLGVLILIGLAFWPARVARRKGHSWLLFFIFSLFLFFPALITAYVVRDRRRA